MLRTIDQYHNILKNENLKTTPDNSFFFSNSVKFLKHKIQNNHIQPLKSKIDGFLNLQPAKNKKIPKLCRISYVHFKKFL